MRLAGPLLLILVPISFKYLYVHEGKSNAHRNLLILYPQAFYFTWLLFIEFVSLRRTEEIWKAIKAVHTS